MPYKEYIYLLIYFFKVSVSLSKKAWKIFFVYAVHEALKIPLFLNIYLV